MLGHSDLVWLLGSLCQLNRLPFDARLLMQNFPPPHTDLTLVEAAMALGFRLGRSAFGAAQLAKMPTPLIAFLKTAPGAGGESAAGGAAYEERARAQAAGESPRRPALVLRADEERLLYFEAGSHTPKVAPLDALAERFDSDCLLVAYESPADAQLEDGAPAARAFGFRWFAQELLKHKRVWQDVLAASLFLQLIALVMPLFTQVVIDKVVVHRTESTLVVIAAGLAISLAFGAAMSWLRQYLVLHTGNRVDAVLGSAVFRHLLRLPLGYFERRPTGVLIARLHAVETVREFMAGAALSLVLDLPFLVVFLFVMFVYSWELSLIAVAILAAVAVLGLLTAPVLRARLNRQFLLGARNQAFLTEYVSGMETVKSLQMEPRLEKRYDDYLASYLSAGFSTRRLSNTYNVAASALEQAMTVAILCVGALLVMRSEGFTIGMLIAFQMFASRLSQPMLRLASLWQEFQQAHIAVKRLGDIMDAPCERYALAPSRAGDAKGEVDADDLGFRYSQEHPWLYRGLKLRLSPGTLTVLSGASGSGKSTLAKLLLGFYPPGEGRIRIDGRDIRNFSANELREYYGVVPQETYLFSGTVYENLSAATPHAGFPDVVIACKAARIHDFIETLPGGYNTPIGEHGVGLSGGQKQRLAIARAILKRPKVLIFDEAASNLDRETAEQLAATINGLKGQATILYIAHQVPRGLEADQVIELASAS